MSHTYRYERPALAADVVLLGLDLEGLQVLLVRRGIAPFRDAWSLPGGHVDPGENVTLAATRELSEETGLSGIELVQLGTYADAGRDPRGWTATVAHLGVVIAAHTAPRGGDDAAEARWFSVRTLPELAFDHATIINDALHQVRQRRPSSLGSHHPAARRGTLTLLGGLPASGKSTFARALVARNPRLFHLDTDLLRLDLTGSAVPTDVDKAWWLHDTARSLAEWCLYNGQDVVIDVTSLSFADRAHYLAQVVALGARSRLVWCQTSERVAAQRLKRRAAGEDPLDRSTAGRQYRARKKARVQPPDEHDEADELYILTPRRFEALADLLEPGETLASAA